MPNYEGIAFKVIISKNFDGVVFKTVMLSGAKIMDSQINAESTWSSEHLAKLLPKGEASGSIASFDDGAGDVPLISCVVEFMASQASGTPTPSAPIPIVGVDKVNFSRCGKNLVDIADKSNITIQTTLGTVVLKAGTYVLSANVKNNGSISCYLTLRKGLTTKASITVNANEDTRKSTSFTLTETDTYTVVCSGSSAGYDFDVSDLQIEFGSTATDYEPYNGTTALINLGGTYYGGSVDAVTGKITLTHQFYNTLGANISNVFEDSRSWRVYYSSPIYGTNFQYKEGLCDKLTFKTSYSGVNDNNNSIAFPSSAGTHILLRNDALTSRQEVRDFMTTLNVVYPLATPIVVYASNTAEIPTKVGDNQVFADSGDVDVQYFLDIKKYIDNLVNSSNTRTLSNGLNLTREAPSIPDEVEEEEEESQETNEER